MGIGAGWYEHEYKGYGFPFPKPSVRIGELGEAVEIMQRMWTEDVVDYDGEHYRLQGGICRPRPLQSPHIPLWIAGGGEQLTLNVAARHAQYTNFGGSVEKFLHKSDVLRRHCADVGRDFDEVVRSANFNVICAATEAEVEERLGRLVDRLLPLVGRERAERTALGFRNGGTAGTPEQLVATLSEWKNAGLRYAISYMPDLAYDRTGLELYAAEVIPALAD
jgi:alkanesulfonate monooxygenase SsuD/methylene tetrahydromethanopterin reductase-like flavin-dependent oxidoreductase (luciferase family)